MSRSTRTVAAIGGVAAALVAAALAVPGTAGAVPASGIVNACTTHPAPGYATCFAQVRATAFGAAKAFTGYTPTQIRNAYSLPIGAHQTVAIVDAYNDPKAESDLATYRSNFGLPPCTTANGCFRKVNQTGGTTYPANNVGWSVEITLDLDAVSAACRTCHILLVEANNSSFANLGTAVNYAASQGVSAISNSYGGGDGAPLAAYDHPGIAVTASTGDSGYVGASAPASFDSVVAVGGTTLHRNTSTSRGWAETTWSGAGSGCSTRNTKPAWQTSATQCNGKASADVSAVANPNTGLRIYDTFSESGWFVVGGTSLSSPIIASVYAMGGNLSGYPAAYTWGHTSTLNDVTVGSNGSCSPNVWCHAGAGWDGPTGLGTPNGIGSF
jgi:subtilase family serine protease